ncbi:MAG: STAS domain-containing protein [Acidobacteriota bacterium]|jgi:anti-sigma B factor antagonist|nr:STAS domain-containing protein [Bryobacteraceae bacterium CoA2 C42]
MIEITEREKEGIVVLDCAGQLVAGESTGALRARLSALIAAGKSQLILNLAEVNYIDSSGLGALVMCFSSARRAGGMMKLVHLSRRTVELIVLTRLETVFEIFDDEQSAVNSFFPDREIRKFDILSFLQHRKSEG